MNVSGFPNLTSHPHSGARVSFLALFPAPPVGRRVSTGGRILRFGECSRGAIGGLQQSIPGPVWANLRQRALDVALREINAKTDLNINGRVAGAIGALASNCVDFRDQDSSCAER